MLRLTSSQLVLALGLVLRTQQQAWAFTVPIRDTDDFKEVCSGMWGGGEAHIEVSFDPSSSGQVALVMYEWNDVPYLGVDTPEGSVGSISPPKTYICTDSAIRQGLCTSSQSGAFITSLPDGKSLESTSIFTQALRFGSSGEQQDFNTNFDTSPNEEQEQQDAPEEQPTEVYNPPAETGGQEQGNTYDDPEYIPPPSSPDPSAQPDPDPEPENDAPGEQGGDDPGQDDSDAGWGWWKRSGSQKRQTGIGLLDGIGDAINGMAGQPVAPAAAQEDDGDDENGGWGEPVGIPDQAPDDSNDIEEGGSDNDGVISGAQDGQDGQGEEADPGTTTGVVSYNGPISYPVRNTGYYCVGVVPVTLLNSRDVVQRQDATHAEYSGAVLFRNTFDGELPAVEYPKINFYLVLSVIYFALGCTWAFLCVRHRNELLPMQYYISGTIVFLIIEMLANFAYYRYINKHGGGASSLAFLFVVSVLNAARNSLSFFLLLIVSMGLSVVTQSLGSVMNKIRILTGFHFIFGVLYSVGTVEVELDSASLAIVMILIFPLALTLTAFLMWIIVSLNGTILHLRAQKQRYKLQKFQTLWRILIVAVIAVAAFFVVSSMSLSNRLDEDYAPKNWRWRWILLDGSLATIYLCVFAAISWLWRPTRDNVRFSMSQELAQDEMEADAEDYEFAELENGNGGHNHQPLPTEEDDFDGDLDEDARSLKSAKVRGLGQKKNGVGEENVVFQMGEDSDDEGEGEPGSPPEYRDDQSGSNTPNTGGKAKGDKDD